jgi:hypothetical protein
VHEIIHSIVLSTHSLWMLGFYIMENGMKLQLRLESQHDYILVLSYVLYNSYSCVLTVKDEPDQQTFEMSMSRVLEFKSCFEFDVVQYCNMMGISFEYDNY